jgi:hypothetical protein
VVEQLELERAVRIQNEWEQALEVDYNALRDALFRNRQNRRRRVATPKQGEKNTPTIPTQTDLPEGSTLFQVMKHTIEDEDNEEPGLEAARQSSSAWRKSDHRGGKLEKRAMSLQRRLPSKSSDSGESEVRPLRASMGSTLVPKPGFLSPTVELTKSASTSKVPSRRVEPPRQEIEGFKKRTATKAGRLKRERQREEQMIGMSSLVFFHRVDVAIKADWEIHIWTDYDKVWPEDNPNPNIVFKTDPESGEVVIEAGSLNELVKYLTSSSSSI